MELTLRMATMADAPLLAAMNRQLADDEQSRNNMTGAALTERMRQWLSESWQAVVIEAGGGALGYALFQVGHDYYNPALPEVYVRQFFIAREQRRQGLGRDAFARLTSEVFPPGATIHLDVLATNPSGQQFWATLGFQTYSIALRRTVG